ncbi:MAG: hypothetical protein LBT15_04330 [Synergistaceae bacterium]|jgi:cadmium resistance protein CadD (predicted permease)|nr:hypothetical protein [Synergistaceae bacterium]
MPFRKQNKIPFRRKGSGKSSLRDIVLFGRVVSVGFLIGGYAVAGVYIAQWMKDREYPPLLVGLTPIIVGIFGIWQGWLCVRGVIRNGEAENGKEKEKESTKLPL